MPLDASPASATIGGMQVDEILLILAFLASSIVLLRAAARVGVLGWQMQNFVFQNRHPEMIAILACVFWTAWACIGAP